MDQPSPDSPLLGSTSSPKKKSGLNASLFRDPSSPISLPSETEDYLSVEDSDSDDDDDKNNDSSDTNRPTKRWGMSTFMVMLVRLLLLGLTLANLINWSVVGWLSKNPFVILSYIELVFMLITNGGFIFNLTREENNRPASSGSNLDDLRIPRISLAVGDWSCDLGVCAFHTALWWDLDDWTARLIIGYVVGGFQLLAAILNQVKLLDQRTTIEVAYHGIGPTRKDHCIQPPVDAETAIPPLSVAA